LIIPDIMATGDTERSRRAAKPPAIYTPDDSFLCVMDAQNPTDYTCIHNSIIAKSSGKRVLVKDGNTMSEKIIIARDSESAMTKKAQVLSRVASQPLEEEVSGDDNDGNSGRRSGSGAIMSNFSSLLQKPEYNPKF
ncbi:unnamed protein product, partial [Didymodactylos carnosus]